MSELFHECGLAAVYHLLDQGTSRLISGHGSNSASRMIPGMLVDMQNRGQLAAGMSTYNPDRDKLLVKWKDVGTVSEVFRLNHRAKFEDIMRARTRGRPRSGMSVMPPAGRKTAATPSRSNIATSKNANGSVSRSTASWPIIRSFATKSSTIPK